MTLAIEHEHFTLELPDGWHDCSDPDNIAFADADGTNELHVSVLVAKRLLRPRELPEIAQNLIEHRVRALSQMASGALTILSAQSPTGRSPVVASFTAHDTRNHAYARVHVVAYLPYVVSISYYRHRCTQVSPQIEEHAQVIMSGCAVTPA